MRLFQIPCVAAASCVAMSSWGQESACLFGNNQAATVQIEFKYKTEADGSDVERGSGFLISPTGYVLTNAHVVSPRLKGADVKVESASVFVKVGSIFKAPVEAEIVVRDTSADLALLRLPPKQADGWPTVTLGQPRPLGVGSKLTAMGFADGGDLAIVPGGEKTANNAVIDGSARAWWQTSLALNKGNSGGPVFGQLGTVVGIAVAKNSNSQQVTFVIPISQAQHLLDIAEVQSAPYGRCAVFPECRHATHPIERYMVDELVGAWGDWRGGGYNQAAYCGDLLAQLQKAHPESVFTQTRSDEKSREYGIRQFEYRYFCEFRRREQPVFSMARTAACVQ